MLCALLYAAAGGGTGAAVCPHAAGTWIAALVAAAVGAAAWRPLRGSLRWDGACWQVVAADGKPRAVGVPMRCIDAGHWLLLRLTEGERGGTRWTSLRASDAGSRWHDLRVALIAHDRKGREGSA